MKRSPFNCQVCIPTPAGDVKARYQDGWRLLWYKGAEINSYYAITRYSRLEYAIESIQCSMTFKKKGKANEGS